MKKKRIFYSLVLTAAAVAGTWWVWKNFFTEEN